VICITFAPATNMYPPSLGLCKMAVIVKLRPWSNMIAVELETLSWVGWFNNRRLLEPAENIPPAEFEALYDRQEAGSVGWLDSSNPPSGNPAAGKCLLAPIVQERVTAASPLVSSTFLVRQCEDLHSWNVLVYCGAVRFLKECQRTLSTLDILLQR